MKEKPILFSLEMVRAILDGRKTQTRRVVKFPFCTYGHGLTGQLLEHLEMKLVFPMPKGGFVFWDGEVPREFSDSAYKDSDDGFRCPYGDPLDRLWVRETWRTEELDDSGLDGVRYRADDIFRPIENTREAAERWGDAHRKGNPWRPSIYMPRWASRITLEIVNVRVERVREISLADIRAEGINAHFPVRKKDPLPTARSAFARLWDDINAKRGFGWNVNPWVWVIEFQKAGG